MTAPHIFSVYRKALKEKNGVKLRILTTGRILYIMPLSICDHEQTDAVLLSVFGDGNPGTIIFDPKFPPSDALAMATQRFPLKDAIYVYDLMLRIFFLPAEKHSPKVPVKYWIDYPKFKNGRFKYNPSPVKESPKQKKKSKTHKLKKQVEKLKKQSTKQTNDSTPTKAQSARSSRFRTPATIIDADC